MKFSWLQRNFALQSQRLLVNKMQEYDDSYTMGEFFNDVRDELKKRRSIARNNSHENAKRFFIKNGVAFEEGVNTLIFRTVKGTVAYYPPSGRMQYKTEWRTCSPTACLKFIKNLIKS